MGYTDDISVKFTFLWANTSILLGMIIGQLVFGVLSDAIGRLKTFNIAAGVMIMGGILSTLPGIVDFSQGSSNTFEFGAMRFTFGIGAGGMYPLIATITRESTQKVGTYIHTYIHITNIHTYI
jgi:MFS family permease